VFEKLAAEVDAQLVMGSPSFLDEGESSTQFVEATIPPDSRAVGKTLVELGLPREAVVVSIERGKATIIPHGDSLMAAGDKVTILCKRNSVPAVKELLLSSSQPQE
jgi:Trk K+ transport system NAD-binding subunit